MIFLTVGSQFPFNRLVEAADSAIGAGLIQGKFFAQVGRGGYHPKNMEYAEILDKGAFDRYFQKATGIISHAGMGTIAMALEYGKPLLVLPRLRSLGELVSDHQVATARKFSELGHILVAYSVLELPEKLKLLKSFAPHKRIARPELVARRITKFIDQIMMT